MSEPDVAELREKLAAIEHERWADWQKWCHKILRANIKHDIEPTLARWEKQIATPYSKLTRQEQLSDLEQVDRYWPLIESYISNQAKELISQFEAMIGEYENKNGWDGENSPELARDALRQSLRHKLSEIRREYNGK